MSGHVRIWPFHSVAESAYKRPDQFPPRIRLLRWLGRQVWIPKGQDFLLRRVYDPEAGKHFYFEIDFFGQRYRGDLAHYLDWLVFCYGAAPYCEVCLLRDLAAQLRKIGRAPLSFYDIGANVGHHALFMAPLVENVCAFEPFGHLIRLFEEKLALNGVKNVRIFPFALGDSNARADYFPGSGANPGAGSLLADFPGVDQSSVAVDVKQGDAVIEAGGLPRMDIVKLDVQGFEPRVLRGLARTIARDQPAIMLEMTDLSRVEFGTFDDFAQFFYPGALFAEVKGRQGRTYTLHPFDYARSEEALVVPPALACFFDRP